MSMDTKKIAIFLFDGFSDWEIAYLTPEIKKSDEFELIYFSKDGNSVSSMGGLRVSPDISLSEIDTANVHMLILPGGTAWESGGNREIDGLVQNLFTGKTPIAAICGATVYLAEQGLLDNLKHTSNDLNYLKGVAPSYRGEAHYQSSLAVTDKNIITANGISPIEFAVEIFKKIALHSDDDIEKWFQLFKNGVWSG